MFKDYNIVIAKSLCPKQNIVFDQAEFSISTPLNCGVSKLTSSVIVEFFAAITRNHPAGIYISIYMFLIVIVHVLYRNVFMVISISALKLLIVTSE